MIESANRYAIASRGFMGKAWEYLAENDLPQASEKGWGAAAEMVKAVAEERGWPHRSHHLLSDIIEDLVDETGDPELSDFFLRASMLHVNFYENGLRSRTVRRALQTTQELISRLEPLLDNRTE